MNVKQGGYLGFKLVRQANKASLIYCDELRTVFPVVLRWMMARSHLLEYELADVERSFYQL
jgi:hypothetical protein